MNISTDEKLNLKKLLDQSSCDDNTELMKRLKHSNLIANDINTFKKLRSLKPQSTNVNKESSDEEFIEECRNKCIFIYKNYTDIFNKLVKDELDLNILTKFLVVLKMIEDGKVDQHEGSVIVGKLLKELYVDSALRLSEHLDEKYSVDSPQKIEGVKMSWKEYKKIKPC